ncbi:MAG TPA: polysaccharide deacetylase family protein [Gaiellales bacterium]|nr:polysaccharide deacetylase family protein [Gaiellales bacterium]
MPDRLPTRRLLAALAAACCAVVAAVAAVTVTVSSAPVAAAATASAAGLPPEIHLTDPRDSHGPLDVRSMRLIQSTSDIVWRFATQRPFQISQMGTNRGRTACLFVHPKRSSAAEEEVCLTGKRGAHAMYRAPIGPHGKRAGWVAATTSRPTPSSAIVEFPWAALGLGRGRFDFSMLAVWAGTPACPAHACRDTVPDAGVALWRIDRFRATGCVAAGASRRFNGPAAGKMVALSFDDGPSIYTPQVLSILNHYGAHATFFEVGEEVAAYPGNSRKVIASGDVIGNHTWSHPVLTTANVGRQVSRAEAEIKRTTGFAPCLLRPPYGDGSPAVISAVRRMGMLTIIWNVDPRDWSLPGTSAIVQRVLSAVRPGAIVVMHDGGGPRSETVQALQTIVPTLLARGYRLVTVPRLLGLSTRYTYSH